MTTCATWREELIDHALGKPAGAALTAHLATCASCTAALADRRAWMVQLDAGVRVLVVREPSSILSARVLAEVHSLPARTSLVWWLRKAVVVVTLAAGVVGVTYDVSALNKERARSTAVASASAELSRWRAPTDMLLLFAPGMPQTPAPHHR